MAKIKDKFLETAPGGGGSLELVAKTEVTTQVASVIFTGLTEGVYKVILKHIRPSGSSQNLQFAFGINASTFRNSSYHTSITNFNATTLSRISNYDGIAILASQQGSLSGQYFHGEMMLYDMNIDSINSRYLFNALMRVSGDSLLTGAGICVNAEINSSIRFSYSSANISEGEFILYKVKEE